MMWARVKAEAEDQLLALGQPTCVCVRPGGILPEAPTGMSRWVMAPLLKIAPNTGIRADDLGRAMLKLGIEGHNGDGRPVLENREIRKVIGL